MKDICTVLCLLSVLAAGCLSTQHESDSGPISVAHLGKRVTVEGKAVNRKIGALLVTPSSPVWIEGLSGWPKGYYSNNTKLKKVRVTGILIEDHGLPVWIPKKNDPPRQLIEVAEGTDLKKASHRYLIKNAKWELLQE